jgi:hypothetical protein
MGNPLVVPKGYGAAATSSWAVEVAPWAAVKAQWPIRSPDMANRCFDIDDLLRADQVIDRWTAAASC